MSRTERMERASGGRSIRNGDERRVSASSMLRTNAVPTVTITGYACACPDTTAPSTPGLVLDPFMGTGTTLVVAKMLGRDSIGVDLSADYCRLAGWRTTDPKQMARALQPPKKPVEPEPAPEPLPEPELTLADRVLLATTRDELSALWQEAKAAGVPWTPELTRLGKQRLAELEPAQ